MSETKGAVVSKRKPAPIEKDFGESASVESNGALCERKTQRIFLLIVLAVLLVCIGLAGVAFWLSRKSPEDSLSLTGSCRGANVLLITLDTLRVDCLACYGHSTVKTPVLDAFAGGGVKFTQCSATAPITLPSHLSILTSTYPYVHGARNNGRFVADEPNITLAERLKELGYTTGAEVGAYVLHKVWGINQGFDSYRSEKEGVVRNEEWARARGLESEPAESVCDRAVEWLDQHGKEKFFLWTHFFDPHLPWVAPERFRRMYEHLQYGDYLAEISYVDEQLGRLFKKLEQLGVLENTIIVVTADHGEAIGAHEEPTHGYYVYDVTMHVPLMMDFPGNQRRGLRVTGQVSTVDIGTTILSLLGADAPDNVQGRSLLPLIEKPVAGSGLTAYGESVNAHDTYGFARLRCIRTDGWKYIHAPIPELYNLREDPNELVNVAARFPEQLAFLQDQMESLVKETMPDAGGGEAVQLSAEARQKLGALGYVGRYTSATDVPELELLYAFEGPDPKEMINVHNKFIRMRELQNSRNYAEAEKQLKELLADFPESAAFLDQMALLLEETEKWNEAAKAYENLLKIESGNALSHFRYAKVLGQLERIKDSISHFQKAVELMPKYIDAHIYYGLALIRQGDYESGIRSFKNALELDPTSERAYMGISEAFFAERRFEEMISVLRKGVQAIPASIQIKNNLAWHLSTLPDSEYRDGKAAVSLAEDMLAQAGGSSRPDLMDTLASAYAEAGEFERAVKTATEAISLAEKMGVDDLARELRERLKLFESGLPYHINR